MSTLSTLNSQKSTKTAQLAKYNTRLTQVEKIQKSLINDFIDNFTEINKKNDEAALADFKGIKRDKSIFYGDHPLKELRETRYDYDMNLKNVQSQLSSEIKRINKKINELKEDIKILIKKIEAEKEKAKTA